MESYLNKPEDENSLPQPHADDLAVDKFAAMMKDKLAKSREKGRSGWDDPDQCSVQLLAKLLITHIKKGDPVDVANLAMMLALREADKEVFKTAYSEIIDFEIDTFVRGVMA